MPSIGVSNLKETKAQEGCFMRFQIIFKSRKRRKIQGQFSGVHISQNTKLISLLEANNGVL